jgi:hypothetical protein
MEDPSCRQVRLAERLAPKPAEILHRLTRSTEGRPVEDQRAVRPPSRQTPLHGRQNVAF